MPYPEHLVAPMREELTRVGVQELKTADETSDWLGNKAGTALLIFNSVCGCAAGGARPGVMMAIKHGTVPDRIATVFAGQDVDAVAIAREAIADVPPSSPSIALFKDGELVYFMPRHAIEGRSPQMIADELTQQFDKFCSAAAK